MTNVYLLSSDAETASNINLAIVSIGGLGVNACSWVFPWSRGFASLLVWIRSLLPQDHTGVVVSEVTGDYYVI